MAPFVKISISYVGLWQMYKCKSIIALQRHSLPAFHPGDRPKDSPPFCVQMMGESTGSRPLYTEEFRLFNNNIDNKWCTNLYWISYYHDEKKVVTKSLGLWSIYHHVTSSFPLLQLHSTVSPGQKWILIFLLFYNIMINIISQTFHRGTIPWWVFVIVTSLFTIMSDKWWSFCLLV